MNNNPQNYNLNQSQDAWQQQQQMYQQSWTQQYGYYNQFQQPPQQQAFQQVS